METETMATPTETHAVTEVREKPTQGIFIGWLALGLLVFALLFALFGIIAGLTHTAIH
jgi:hypothetical protein